MSPSNNLAKGKVLYFSEGKGLCYLGDVMADIVNHIHVQIIWRLTKHFAKRLPHKKRHGGAVNPGVVGGGSHAAEVVSALGAVDARACQLPIVDEDVVT